MLNFHLKYNQCGCDNGDDNICHGFLCKTVDCEDNQVIPYSYSGSGIFNPSENQYNNGYTNLTPIKYNRPASCRMNITVNGIIGSYFLGLNGIHLCSTDNINNSLMSFSTFNGCLCDEDKSNRFSYGTASLLLSGPDITNPNVGVIDGTYDDNYIYNNETWNGSKPTIWIKMHIYALAGISTGSHTNFSVSSILYGNTGIEYDGDYIKFGNGIAIPSPACGYNINTGSLDCRNLNLSASLNLNEETLGSSCEYFTDEEIRAIVDIDCSSITVTIQSVNSEIDNHIYNSVEDGDNSNSIFGFCVDRRANLSIFNVEDESNKINEDEIELSTCDCSSYLNREYSMYKVLNNLDREDFSINSETKSVTTICPCSISLKDIHISFANYATGPYYKTISYIYFYDENGATLATFKKEFNNIGPEAIPLTVIELTNVTYDFVSQTVEMDTDCDFRSATVTLSLYEAPRSQCLETVPGCPTFCLGWQNEVLLTIPSFILDAHDFTQDYRWFGFSGPSIIYAYGPICPPGYFADTEYNAYIDDFIALCGGGTYTFIGGEYILSNSEDCVYTYGSLSECYGDNDIYIVATLINGRFRIQIWTKYFLIDFDDIDERLPYHVCCNSALNMTINCTIIPVEPFGIGEYCGDYPAIPMLNQCTLGKVIENLDTCESTTTFPVGFVYTGTSNCGLDCSNGVINSFSCYDSKNVNLTLETL